jgi:hypothetical protein
MSNTERLMKQGLLIELCRELDTLENRAENCVKALREAMFVITSHLDLDTGNIVVGATDLDAVVKQAASVRDRIAKLEDDLGL